MTRAWLRMSQTHLEFEANISGPSLCSPITRHNVRLIWLQRILQQVFRQDSRDIVSRSIRFKAK